MAFAFAPSVGISTSVSMSVVGISVSSRCVGTRAGEAGPRFIKKLRGAAADPGGVLSSADSALEAVRAKDRSSFFLVILFKPFFYVEIDNCNIFASSIVFHRTCHKTSGRIPACSCHPPFWPEQDTLERAGDPAKRVGRKKNRLRLTLSPEFLARAKCCSAGTPNMNTTHLSCFV